MRSATLLITGATGLVGSHLAERAVADGYAVRALVRSAGAERQWLERLGVEIIPGSLTDDQAVRAAVRGVNLVVHCAAMVGDWGPIEEYRKVNVDALRTLLEASLAEPNLDRFVAMSSLGVYQARDHYGTDETTPPWSAGIDGYTRTKTESELLVRSFLDKRGLRGVILRPGFIYGARDRQVLPRLIDILKTNGFWYFGSGEQKLNNTGVKNLVDAVMLALTKPEALGETFNITDDPLVSRVTFIETVTKLLGISSPKRRIPKRLALPLALTVDRCARLVGAKEAPRLSMARYKFLALNLEYSIAKAKQVLGYAPRHSFERGMAEAIAWFRSQGLA